MDQNAWEAWLRVHKGVASLLMPGDDIEAVLGCKGQSSSVSEPIARLHASSRTGASVLSFCRDMLGSHAIKVKFDECIAKIVSKDFSAECIAEAREECEKLTQKFVKSKVTNKREIVFEMSGMKGKVVVTSAMAEWETALNAAIKNASLGKTNGVALMTHELMLMDAAPAADACVVLHYFLIKV